MNSNNSKMVFENRKIQLRLFNLFAYEIPFFFLPNPFVINPCIVNQLSYEKWHHELNRYSYFYLLWLFYSNTYDNFTYSVYFLQVVLLWKCLETRWPELFGISSKKSWFCPSWMWSFTPMTLAWKTEMLQMIRFGDMHIHYDLNWFAIHVANPWMFISVSLYLKALLESRVTLIPFVETCVFFLMLYCIYVR